MLLGLGNKGSLDGDGVFQARVKVVPYLLDRLVFVWGRKTDLASLLGHVQCAELLFYELSDSLLVGGHGQTPRSESRRPLVRIFRIWSKAFDKALHEAQRDGSIELRWMCKC